MFKTTVSTLACALIALLCAQPLFAQTARRDTTLTVVDGETALKQLMDGNARFISGDKMNPDRDKAARAKVATSQRPMAIILSCADSRVAPEILFDAGVGDLFVIRLAGNTLTEEGQASMEYAVAVLQCQLIMVLGHESCGAVDAGIKAYRDGATFPGSIDTLLDSIEPAVAIASAHGEVTLEAAIDENVRVAAKHVELAGTILPRAIAEGNLKVVGGVYHLETGKVELLDLD
ncbi:carbonic anhydrase [Cerasicoccus maritimus]|uniref:carbonic anhydrase n=1 Tax=Cerasicoccus maritimus TaxID=490089 RepID=UPI00285273D4|nr:carbonic anhydrase [Cerasicoccus maritimus]